MTRLLGFLAMALLLAPPPARATDEALTLRDVIELHRSGLGDDLLIAVIDADSGAFRLSYADIQDLKSDGLSERVIAALVRSGARRTAMGAGEAGAPVIHVTQEVHTWAPTSVAPTIVLVQPEDMDRSSGHRHQPSAASPPPPPPPATWVTRRDDGRNVSSAGDVRSGRPAASWVTPRDPAPRDTPDPATPTPKSR